MIRAVSAVMGALIMLFALACVLGYLDFWIGKVFG